MNASMAQCASNTKNLNIGWALVAPYIQSTYSLDPLNVTQETYGLHVTLDD
jgi:hypothetical protein